MPNCDPNWLTSAGSPVRNDQTRRLRPHSAACAFSTRGVSNAGSSVMVTSRTSASAGEPPAFWSAAKCRFMSGQNSGIGQRVYMNVSATRWPRSDVSVRGTPVSSTSAASATGSPGSQPWGGSRSRPDVAGLHDRGEMHLDLPDDQRRRDQVARLFSFEERAVLHREGHRHPGHEALDVLVLDGHLPALGSNGQDLACQFVLAGLGRPCSRRQGDRRPRTRTTQHSVQCNHFHRPRPLHVASRYKPPRKEIMDAALRLGGISKSFGQTVAVDGIW